MPCGYVLLNSLESYCFLSIHCLSVRSEGNVIEIARILFETHTDSKWKTVRVG